LPIFVVTQPGDLANGILELAPPKAESASSRDPVEGAITLLNPLAE